MELNIDILYCLSQVDFIWINRDQKSFEWFVSLLAQLELEQTMEGGLSNFLEMHMYMTSALNKTDLKGLGLQMALDLIHKHQHKDLLTGLHTRTQPGRPDFKKVRKWFGLFLQADIILALLPEQLTTAITLV